MSAIAEQYNLRNIEGCGHFSLRERWHARALAEAWHCDKCYALLVATETQPVSRGSWVRDALEAAEYALTHPESDQGFALSAVRAALNRLSAVG